MHLKKISLIGVGLLGGSLGLAIRKRELSARVHAYVRRAGRVWGNAGGWASRSWPRKT